MVTLSLRSDRFGFVQLPDGIWASPDSITAIAGEDTLEARPGASGVRTGFYLYPIPPESTEVTLRFDTLSLRVPATVRMEVGEAARTAVETGRPPDHNLIQQQGLYISGTKRIGLSVGNGGGLDQGTRITIDGTAAPGITVSGSVTDQNLTGISSSELISQLDRIYFTVEGESWRARLGDMEWQRGDGDTGPLAWRKEISGIDFALEPAAGWGGGAGYGTTAAERSSTTFLTTEGVQGPYDIAGGWEVVPGSERVRLDGQLMERGSTADYEMEYTAGLLTFTAWRLIRADQRVEVTFYRTGDGFRKDLFTATTSMILEGFTASMTGLHAADDRESPLGFELTPDAEEILRSAGEDPAEAWLDGAEYAGEGNGSYDLDSLGHYVYAGPGLGAWTVVFGRPPNAPGDYIYSSVIGGYVWQGEGLGTHLARRYVQIPTAYSTGGTLLEAGGETLGGTLEAAFSRRTGNLFNPDATTREGGCFTLGLHTDAWEDGPTVGITARKVTDGYRPPGELEADSTLSSWTLPAGYDGRDDILEAYAGGERLTARAAVRLMGTGGTLQRYALSTSPVFGAVSLQAGGSFTGRRGTPAQAVGNRTNAQLSADLTLGILAPYAGVGGSFESWEDSVSGRVATTFTGIRAELGSGTAGLRLELQDDAREGTSSGPFTVWRGRLEGTGGPASWRFGGSAEHSSTEYDMGGRLDADAIFATVTGTTGDIWFQSVYSGSGTVSRSLEVIYEWVGEGEGSYGFDPETGQYYPDPDGGYEVSYQPGSAGSTVTSASLETTVSSGGAGAGLSASLRLSAVSPNDRTRTLLLFSAFDPGSAGGYSATLSPWWRWEEGLLRRFTMEGTLSDERTAYSGTGTLTERRWSMEAAPDLRPLEILALDLSLRLWREEEELYMPRDVRGLRLEADPVLLLSPGSQAGILTAVEQRREVNSGLEARLFEGGPHFSWNGGGWSSMTSVTAGWIPGETAVPSWLFDGETSGLSWRTMARVGRSIGSGLDISLFYWGRKKGADDWLQGGGLEGTVSF
jgi:hypothetical protein